jgi:hypothetical protein
VSYDYLMVRAPAGAIPDLSADEDLEAALLAFAEAFGGEPIGSLDAVKTSISGLFPSLRWQQQKFELAPHMLVAQLGDWSWSTASGADAPEFSLGLDEDGHVRIISASRVERDELNQVARALGLLVLDEQTLEMLSG